MPPEVTSATVHEVRENNRVVDVSTRVVFGTPAAVALALLASAVSWAVNTCFVERHNGTDRNRCSRKVRKSYALESLHNSRSRWQQRGYGMCNTRT